MILLWQLLQSDLDWFPKWSSLKPWKGHLGVQTRSLGRSWWVFLICVCLFPLCFHYVYLVSHPLALAYLLDSANSEGWDSWSPRYVSTHGPRNHYQKINCTILEFFGLDKASLNGCSLVITLRPYQAVGVLCFLPIQRDQEIQLLEFSMWCLERGDMSPNRNPQRNFTSMYFFDIYISLGYIMRTL